MPRLPRIILANTPHHITQRGNRKQTTFFNDGDYDFYLKNMHEMAEKFGVEVVSYCLMPNHVHLLLVPHSKDSLVQMISYLHEKYSKFINARFNWKGHLWQGRFFSTPLSSQHYENCISYIESNPIRAGLVQEISEYKWVSKNSIYSNTVDCHRVFNEIRKATQTGKPCGTSEFLKKIGQETGIDFEPKKVGRPFKEKISQY
jgi:putative transposase